MIWGWGVVVPVVGYRAAFPEAKEYDPFRLAAAHTIIHSAFMGAAVNSNVKLWFEESRTTDSMALKLYHDLKAVRSWEQSHRLIGVGFASKKVFAAQAADLFARECFKHFDNLNLRPKRKPLVVLDKQCSILGWTDGAFDRLALNGGPRNLEFLTKDLMATSKEIDDEETINRR